MEDYEMDTGSDQDEDEVDMDEFEEAASEGLKSGKHAVPNGDGTYRCPFCVSKKKQEYKYHELLAHAIGVGRGKRGNQLGGQHRALHKYLQNELKEFAAPAAPRFVKLEQAAPKRVQAEFQVVHPWVGLIHNVGTVGPDGRRVSPGPGELRQQFDEFHPEQVKVFWAFNGPLGMAALIFKRDMEGYGDCRLFERSFLEKHRGRQDWLENKGTDRQGKDLYGWMAGEEDYNDKGKVGEFLREKHNLKTMNQLVEEKMRTSEQLQKQLHDTIQQQMQLLAKADTEKFKMSNRMEAAEQASKKAELEMQLLEEKHRQERESLRSESQKATELHNQEMKRRARELEAQMATLQTRYAEMSIKESQNEAERKRLELEREENKKQLETVTKEVEVRNRYREEQLSLIEKHENQQKNLENEIQQQKLHLAKQQQMEIERQHIQETIETEKLKVGGTELSTAKIAELEEKLQDLEEEKDGAWDMVTDLTVSHRKAVDKLEDAKKAAVKVLQALNEDVQAGIGVKRCGEIDDSCWEDVGEAHFNHPDWQAKLCKVSSEWAELIKKHDWMPYKKVYLNEERTKFKEEVNPDDPLLKQLRARFGDKAYNGVATALMEIQEYNASGRYAIPTCWNFAAKVSNSFTRGRAATLEEVVNHLGDVIKTGKDENKKLQAEAKKLQAEVKKLAKGASGGTGRGRGKRKKVT